MGVGICPPATVEVTAGRRRTPAADRARLRMEQQDNDDKSSHPGGEGQDRRSETRKHARTSAAAGGGRRDPEHHLTVTATTRPGLALAKRTPHSDGSNPRPQERRRSDGDCDADGGPGRDGRAVRGAQRGIGVDDDNPPDGLVIHMAGVTDDGMVVIDVWESEEKLNAFFDSTLGPALADSEMEPGPPTVSKLHNMIPQGGGTEHNVIVEVHVDATSDVYDDMVGKMPSHVGDDSGASGLRFTSPA